MRQPGHVPSISERLVEARRLASESRPGALTRLLTDLQAQATVSGAAAVRTMAVEAALLRATSHFNAERLDAALAELEPVAELVPRQSAPMQARYHGTRGAVAQVRGDLPTAVEETVVALAAVEGEPPSAELAYAVGMCAVNFSQTQLFPLAAEAAERAVQVAVAAGEPAGRFHVQAVYVHLTWAMRLDHLGLPEQCREQFGEVIRQHEAALAAPGELPELFRAQGHAERALACARLGRVAEARRFLHVAREVSAEPVPNIRRVLAHAEGAVLLAEGRHDDARAVLSTLWESLRGRRVQARSEDVPTLLGRVEEAAGRPAEALRWFRVVHERYGRTQYETWTARVTAARLRIEQEALVRRASQLERDALYDGLTGIPNRRAFDADLPRLAAASALPGGEPLTLAVFDVDGFKRVNDTYGHHVGDEVLRRVAATLREHARGADRCARYGGDEFVLCLPAGAVDAAVAVARIGRVIADHPWSTVAPGLAVTVTTGLAQLRPGEDATSLFRSADTSLLVAKRARRPAAVTPLGEAVEGLLPVPGHHASDQGVMGTSRSLPAPLTP